MRPLCRICPHQRRKPCREPGGGRIDKQGRVPFHAVDRLRPRGVPRADAGGSRCCSPRRWSFTSRARIRPIGPGARVPRRRPTPPTTAGVDAHQGARRPRTTSWSTSTARRDHVHRREPRELPRRGVPRQHGRPAQRRAGVRAAGLHPGRRRLRRHRLRAAEAEPANTFVTGLIGARPDATSPTTATDRSSSSATACTRPPRACRSSGRATTSGTAGPRARRARSTPSRATARVGAAAGDGTTTGGTDWPISWCRDYQGGRSFYTGMGRTAAAYGQADLKKHLLGAIQWSAGLVRGGCKATIMSNYSTERIVNAASRRPDQQRRVARRLAGQQRLGDLHRPRATAAPTPSAAR